MCFSHSLPFEAFSGMSLLVYSLFCYHLYESCPTHWLPCEYKRNHRCQIIICLTCPSQMNLRIGFLFIHLAYMCLYVRSLRLPVHSLNLTITCPINVHIICDHWIYMGNFSPTFSSSSSRCLYYIYPPCLHCAAATTITYSAFLYVRM